MTSPMSMSLTVLTKNIDTQCFFVIVSYYSSLRRKGFFDSYAIHDGRTRNKGETNNKFVVVFFQDN